MTGTVAGVALAFGVGYCRCSQRQTKTRALGGITRRYGLSAAEVIQFANLVDATPNTSATEPLEQRSLYNQAVKTHLEKMRGRRGLRPTYKTIVRTPSTMRVKLHPPAGMSRYLSSTRDLVTGLEGCVRNTAGRAVRGR